MRATFTVLCLLGAWLGVSSAGRAEDEDRLSTEVQKLEAQIAARLEALRKEYAELESLQGQLKNADRGPLPDAIARAVFEGRSDLAPPAPDRGSRSLAAIRRELRSLLRKQPDIPAALVNGLAVEIARQYGGDPDGVNSIEKVGQWSLAALDRILEPDRPFHDIWNDSLFEQAPVAISWRDDQAKLADLQAKLDRLLNPSAGDPDAPAGMVKIPGGTYEVGPDVGWERKRRRANLRAYYLDVHEVANGLYKAFWDQIEDEELKEDFRPRFWIRSGGTWDVPKGRLDHPVTGVSWPAAAAYAAWANKRLPTEDEWQIAARGEQARRYPWGDQFDSRRCNGSLSGREDTVIVGTSPGGASPFGCLDMAGNVEEWTASLRDGKVLKREPRLLQDQVVVRGGGYQSRPEELATNWRWVYPPGTTQPYLGFRCARDAR